MVSLRRTWIAAAVLWLALASVAAGAVRVDVLSTPKETAPGGVATYVFALSHDRAVSEVLHLTVTAPDGWSALGVPVEITVAPGEEASVSVTLTVPAAAAPGSYILTLQATSAAEPTDAGSAGIATRVAAVNQIELTPAEAGSASPGTSVSYSILVANRGNAQDVVAVTAASSRGYAFELAPATLELSPRESRAVVVTVAIPAAAASGRDVLTVRASSTLHEGVEDETAVFTTILPSGPGGVAGSLYETLPVQVVLGLEHDETTGAFDSRLALSTSGVVLEGTFSAAATALHPFGSAPLELESYSLAYRLDSASFAVGTVSQVLTDLQSVACDGGALSIEARWLDVALIAGGEEDETRFGGRIALGPEEARLGVAYSDLRSPSSEASAWTGIAEAEPIDGWTLRAEGGFGTLDGNLGRAAFFGTAIDVESYFLSAAVFSVDTYFPGPRTDTAGVEASQRLRLSKLSLGLSLGHVWSNVVRDPVAPTLVTDALGVNLATTPWEEGPEIQATLNLERQLRVGGAPQNDVDVLLGYNVIQSGGVFPYAFSGCIDDSMDLVLGTHERTLTHTQEAGLSIDEFLIGLALCEEKVVDVTHGVVLRSAASVSLAVRPASSRHEASIDFVWVGDEVSLEASLLLYVMEDLSVTLGGYAGWDRGDPTGARFGWSLEVSAAFGVPFPFLVTKGRIGGRAFIDANGNGAFDSEEAPAAGAVVFLEAGEVTTDADGAYRFPPLPTGRYTLAVRNLPGGAASGSSVVVELGAGEEKSVDIPLFPSESVRGAVFDDANKDSVRQPEEMGFADVGVELAGDLGMTSTTTDARGEFIFFSVRPGVYTVTLDALTLPERFTFTTAESQSADPRETGQILFGGYVPPRQEIVTFQPPTADAVYRPEAPRVGEDVTFDGSASFDFDGAIAGYSWDFDGDGTEDSDLAVATHAFAAAGRYHVALTVTDDAGNSDTKTLELDVAEPSASDVPLTPTPSAPETAPTVSAPQTPSAEAAAPAGAPTAAAPTSPPSSGLARPPVADFAYRPISPTAGQPVEFDAAASIDFDGAIDVYAWDFDSDGAIDAEGRTVEWTFSRSGSHLVTLTVIDAARMSDAVTTEVEVLASASVVEVSPAGVSARFAYVPQVARVGQAVRFDASASVGPGGQALSYAWDFDADETTDNSEQAAEWTFAATGLYPVTLTVTASAEQSDSLTLAVPVVEPSLDATSSQPPIAAIQYVPSSPAVGVPVMFSAASSVDLDGRIVAYAWDFDADGLLDSTEPIAVHAFSAPGSFVVRLTVIDDSGNSDSVIAALAVE